MPPHRKASRADERRKRRRQQRTNAPERDMRRSRRSTTTPVQMGVQRDRGTKPTSAAASIDRSSEYQLIRQDLVRVTIYSAICLALMVAALFTLAS